MNRYQIELTADIKDVKTVGFTEDLSPPLRAFFEKWFLKEFPDLPPGAYVNLHITVWRSS